MIFFEYIELSIMAVILIALCAISIFFSLRAYTAYSALNKKYELFMSGRDAESLEQYFIDLQNDIDHLIDDNIKNKENIRTLNRITKRSYQKIGIHKYDAFSEKSGKRSFAVALLDFTNTGFVITCQNIQSGSILFIKEVDAGATSIKLGPEEEKALLIAMKQTDKEIKDDT